MTRFPAVKRASSTKITVYVPSTNRKQKFIGYPAFNRRVNLVQNLFTKGKKPIPAFGGSTTVKSVGTYEKGKRVIKERIGLVSSYVPKDSLNPKSRKALNSFLKKKRKTWGQF